MAKRRLHRTVAVLLLLALLMGALAAWLRLDSVASALYRQHRVEQRGHEFLTSTFRSMRAGAAAPQLRGTASPA